MIAVDTNLLVYAHRRDSQWHDRARECIGRLASSPARWAIPWPCMHEFLAIVTHPRIYDPPSPAEVALDQVDAWLEAPSLVMLGEVRGYWNHLRGLVETGRTVGPMVHDARVAALCITHGVESLWTADRDFNRFRDLKVTNPLIV